MIIGTYTTLPNPTQIEKLADVVAVDIDALGGPKRVWIEQDRIVTGARFLWDGLTRDEMMELLDALEFATNVYAFVQCPKLGGFQFTSSDLAEDQMYMTLMPDSSPSVQWVAESLDRTPAPLRPIGYTVRADLVSAPT